MLKGLTSTFKNGCNNVEVMYREYLVLGNQTIPIKAELSDDSYENGNFIGTFIFKTIKFETDAQYDFKNKEFEYYKEVNGESIKIGTFITTEVEINDTTEIVKVVGMDYGLKTQIAYRSQLDYSAGNITLLDVWNEACQLSGLESGIDYFPNGDFIVDNDQFTGTGATIRDVFKGIAMSSGSFVKVMNDDKVYLVFNSYTGDIETTTISGSGSVNDGYAIDNLQIEGKAEQEGTPTPDNPEEIKTVSGIGNLFDTTATPIFNVSNNTIATPIENGVRVTIKNSSSGNYAVVYKLIDVSNYVGKKFTIKMNFVSSVSGKARYMIGLCDENGENRKPSTAIDISGTSYTYTIPTITTSKYLCVWLYSSKSGTATAGDYVDYTNIQVEMSDTIHTPVPYGHWLPVKVSNKNLWGGFSSSVLRTNGGISYVSNNDGTISASGTANANSQSITLQQAIDNNWYITLPAGTYTLSGGVSTVKQLEARNIDNTSIGFDNGNGLTFTLTEETEIYVRAFISNGTSLTGTEIFRPQIEQNSTATEHIEHQEQTTLIDLNKYDENNNIVGNYEICTTLTAPANNLDVLTIKDGRAVLTKRMGKYVADSNSPFYKTGTYDGLYHLSGVSTPSITYTGYRGICNLFVNNPDSTITANASASTNLSDGQFAFRWHSTIPANRDRIYFKYLAIPNDITAFKQLMIDNNFTLYYRQNKEDITLRGTYDINLYEGVNHISIEDELEPTMVMSYYNDNLDIIEDYVELEDKRDTHPWTCLRLGVSQIDGENIDYIDEDLVEKYGENWLILNDNPFAYNQLKRQELITAIFTNIKTFGYSAFVSKTSFKPYLTAGDIVKFRNREGNLVKTILLRYNHNAEEITLESPSETSATVNYVYPLSAVQMAKNIQIEVDKDKEQISSIVEQVGIVQETASSNADNINSLTSLVNGQGEQIDALGTRITQNVSEITASVSAIQEEISEGVGLVKTTSVTIDDSGLNVSTDTSKIKTTMTNDTFKITDSGNTELAKFGYDESQGISVAEMDNLTVKNYFIAGVHRVETIEINGEKRTGWFYMED